MESSILVENAHWVKYEQRSGQRFSFLDTNIFEDDGVFINASASLIDKDSFQMIDNFETHSEEICEAFCQLDQSCDVLEFIPDTQWCFLLNYIGDSVSKINFKAQGSESTTRFMKGISKKIRANFVESDDVSSCISIAKRPETDYN